MLEVLQEVDGCVSSAREAASQAPSSSSSAAAESYCVVSIDHMNDYKGYVGRLERWATTSGLRGAFYCYAAPKSTASGRHEGGVAVLQGDDSAISDWLKRLRSEAVDVDARGKRCKERQAVVLRRSPLKEADDTRLREPWTEHLYPSRALHKAVVDRCVNGDCVFSLGRGPGAFPAQDDRDGCLLNVRVKTSKQTTALGDLDGDELCLDVNAAPREGAANAEICAFFAERLKLKKQDVRIVSGQKHKSKVLHLRGACAADIAASLSPEAAP